jgi:hypothetical protein
MDELVLNRPLTTHDLLAMANRELSAFFSAVTELFGSEQAEASAEDWLHELVARDNVPASPRQWRTLTVTAAARLASRVNASKTKGTSELKERE